MYEFEHWFHSFMKVKKEGGTMTLSHSGSPVFLRIRRGRDTEVGCLLSVDVPRTRWSEKKLDALRDRLDGKGIAADAPTNDIGVLLRIALEIRDVLDETSGATGAHVCRELFKAFGLDTEARFSVTMKGENSLRTWRPTAERWKQEDNPLLRLIGRKIGEGVEREAQSRSEPKARKPE